MTAMALWGKWFAADIRRQLGHSWAVPEPATLAACRRGSSPTPQLWLRVRPGQVHRPPASPPPPSPYPHPTPTPPHPTHPTPTPTLTRTRTLPLPLPHPTPTPTPTPPLPLPRRVTPRRAASASSAACCARGQAAAVPSTWRTTRAPAAPLTTWLARPRGAAAGGCRGRRGRRGAGVLRWGAWQQRRPTGEIRRASCGASRCSAHPAQPEPPAGAHRDPGRRGGERGRGVEARWHANPNPNPNPNPTLPQP